MKEYTEVELSSRLAKLTGEPNSHQLHGGTSRPIAISITILSAIGAFAALMLALSEKKYLLDPQAQLVCDINPLIGCSKWIGAWQNEVFFGVSNSLLGLAGFSALTMIGLVLLSNGRFGKWLWRLLSLGATAGLVWVFWFIYESFVVEGSICPYCFVVWLMTIPLFVILWSCSLQAGHWGNSATQRIGRFLVRNRIVTIGCLYLALFVFAGFWFWDKWALLFS